ncbi:MAG TPA: haloacid dehalogenase-like hydrolase [Symbiobacteriaceae bacterium]
MGIRLAVFDLDGTLLTGSKTVMPTLARQLWRTGQHRLWGTWVFVAAASLKLLRRLGLVDNHRYTLLGTRMVVRWMAKLDPALLEEVLDQTACQLLRSARPQMLEELRQRQTEGYRTVILSAVVQPLLERIAGALGCEAVGTPLEQTPDGRLTGRMGPFCSGTGKREALFAWAARLGEPVDWAHSLAYADTLPDVAVLETVGEAVAVAPEPRLRRWAAERGWRVIEG